MLGLLEALAGYVSVPTWMIVGLIILFLISQVIGEIIELCGKVAPGFMKLRKRAQERKEKERLNEEKMAEMTAALERSSSVVSKLLSKYDDDNIDKRNRWMHSVDDAREDYYHYKDESREDRASIHDELASLAKKLDKNNEITLSLQIENKRSSIINFAARVADPTSIVSHEEFRRVFRIYEEYEKIIAEYKMTNGEVDISIRIIREAYEDRLKTNSFIENERGYNG